MCLLNLEDRLSEDNVIKMASLKVDFYLEALKQLKNHILSYLIGAT